MDPVDVDDRNFSLRFLSNRNSLAPHASLDSFSNLNSILKAKEHGLTSKQLAIMAHYETQDTYLEIIV
jgi:hypothetical protein